MKYAVLFITALFVSGCSECREVVEVLRCGMDECRVVLDTDERATIYNIVYEGDRVYIERRNMKGWVRAWCEVETDEPEKGSQGQTHGSWRDWLPVL